ncbi:MAG TPA: hypothetical protein VGM31_22175, partial [Puia sp.]
MKIAVITGEAPLKQWLSGKMPAGWECVEIDEMEELDRHPDAGLIVDLSFVPGEGRIRQLSGLLPKPVMINSMAYTCAEIGHPFIRINAWPGMVEREVHEIALGGGDEEGRVFVDELYRQLGWKYRIVPDVPGMISGRILAV